MGAIQVNFYETENGKCPVEEFIKQLDTKMYAKALKTIELLRNNGTDLRKPYSACIGDGIFELRVKHGSDISRVLYFFYVGNQAILTNDFIKKTQKTPLTEIELAKKYRLDYKRRNPK